MEKLMKEWEELKSFLPKGWEEKSKESKAICRTRKAGSAEELLHFGEGLSLKETSAVAKEGGISDISSVALYHRARKSAEWLRWICEGMLEQFGTAVTKPKWLEGRRVRAIGRIVGAGGDFVMRLKHKAAKYYDEDGHRVELLPLLRELDAGEVLDVTLHYYSEPRKPASAKPLRICAIRKSPCCAPRNMCHHTPPASAVCR